MSDFDAWYDTVVKYVEPVDVYHWMKTAWDAAKDQKRFDVAEAKNVALKAKIKALEDKIKELESGY